MRDMIDTCLAGLSHMRRRTLVIATSLVAALATLGAGAPALAGLQQEFSVFADCPVNVPHVTTCVYSKVTSGEFTLGSKTVPINKTVILQGGVSSTSSQLVPAADGNTLSQTPLTVPGGLVGIEGLGGEVTATAELAGAVELNAANLLAGRGTAVSLPLKVKLDNPFLAGGCYIGSESLPVEVKLTTGTTNPPPPNKPITGNPGHFMYVADHKIVVVPSSSLVDNEFSVPAANGCGGLLFLLIDPLVDFSAGVPAAAGHNTAIMNGSLETATVSEVQGQKGLPELGRCQIAPSSGEGKGKVYKGGYFDKACTSENSSHSGEYEWYAGPGAKKKFTSTGGKMTLESVGGVKLTCAASSVAGEYTGAKTALSNITLTGCERVSTKEPCQSAKAGSGEIVASALATELGFIEDKANESELLVSVGLDLSREPALLTAVCAGVKEALVLKGSVIAPVSKADKMSSTFSIKYKASAGKQAPEEFEEGPNDTLTATMGFGAEQAGLTTSEKVTNEEPMEIKAEHK